MELAAMIYEMAKGSPETEKFGLVQQICRAGVSVPANIAEGDGSRHKKVYLNHLSVARGSLMEVETYVELVEKVGFVRSSELSLVRGQIDRVSKMLSGLIRSLKEKS